MEIKFQNLIIDGITIDKTQLAKIEQKIFNIQTDLKQNVVNKRRKLYTVAKQYIINMQKALDDFKQLIQIYNKRLKIIDQIKNNDSIAAENYIKTKISKPSSNDVLTLQRELIKITDDFTKKIFKELGKELQLIYVYQSKQANVMQVYKIKDIEILLKDGVKKDSSGGITSRLTATKQVLKSNASAIEEVAKKDYEGGIQQAKELDNMYKEIIYRYNTYRYDYKEKGKVSLVLWNMQSAAPSKWHGMFLFQKGDLAQAYTNLAMNRKVYFKLKGNTNDPPEIDIENFMKLVEQVDATFGGVQADIENEETKLALAVKTLSASPQGILGTLKLAQDLLTENITIENFEEYKKKWKRQGRNTISDFLGDTIQDVLKSQFNQLTN